MQHHNATIEDQRFSRSSIKTPSTALVRMSTQCASMNCKTTTAQVVQIGKNGGSNIKRIYIYYKYYNLNSGCPKKITP